MELCDNIEEPQDLLSRLMRQDAEYDRVCGEVGSLQIPANRSGSSTGADVSVRGAIVAESSRPRHKPTTEFLASARSDQNVERHYGLSSVSGNAEPSTSLRQLAGSHEDHQGRIVPPIERPAQRRFLQELSPPSWLDSSDATR